MLKIRSNVFETNSSSVHSMIMCDDEEYKNLSEGKALITEENEIISIEEAYDLLVERSQEWYNKELLEEIKTVDLNDPDIIVALCCKYDIAFTLEEYLNREYYDFFDDSYTTKNGEIVHAFGYFGHD